MPSTSSDVKCCCLSIDLAPFAMLLGLLLGGFLAVRADKADIRMPQVIPQADTYVCTSVPLDITEEHFLTGFKAISEHHNAHHILLFGCEEPGSNDVAWDCGEMTARDDSMERAPTCASKPAILYAWAKDAPELTLPQGVGFRVGGDSGIRYLVMQVHYMHELKEADESGVTVTYTEEVQPKEAATLLLVTGGAMAPKSEETFETACIINEDVEIHPFAFRTHTHRHGKDVSGWVIQEDEKGDDHWTLIGRRDPQLAQMFVPVENKTLVIHSGDMIAARCQMKNDEDRVITMGSSGDDEMCNFYVMYWANNGRTLIDNTCYSPGAPYYHWKTEAGFNMIPQ